MNQGDKDFYEVYWLQELIAWGLRNNISKMELLNDYYPDEILTIRKLVEMHKARDFMVLLSIASNPHVENPKPLHESLSRMCGPGISNKEYWSKTKLNVSQFERLKQEMGRAQAAKRR